VAGGHTIRNPEPIYGLAVQGLVHPDRVFRKGGALPGDMLMISKPLGTGLVLAAASPEDKEHAIRGMRALNRTASETLQTMFDDVHAVTDVTGYGLAGHGWEMAQRSGVRLVLETAELPAYPGAQAAVAAGIRTGGDPRNREYLAGNVDSRAVDHDALCYDPQTSGGLLAAVTRDAASELASAGWWPVGVVEPGEPRLVLA
jgi:selenide,water dikinase